MFKFLFGLWMILSISASISASANSDLKEIVIALKPDKNPEKMLEERKKLESYLSKSLKVPVKVIVPLSSAVILQGFKNGTVDLGYLGSLDMYNAQKQKAADILLAGEIKGKNFYESYWVTQKGKTYKGIAELKGKAVAFASRTSTSGYLVPHKALIEKGLLKAKESPEKFFGEGNAWYGSGYVTAIERVLDGSAEAAAVSDYVILEDKHLTPEQKSQLRILEKQGPVPTHVIAVRSTLSAKDRQRIQKALLALNEKDNQSMRDQLFTSKLVEVKATQHLEGIAKAVTLTGVEIETK